jgi:SAM-dependent methyltransferase
MIGRTSATQLLHATHMTPRQFAPELAASYNRSAPQYRRDDEIEAQTENHRRIGGNLRRICRSFRQPIRVLEIGCGTGRYFHCLENVKLLVGTDLSVAMLQHARQPLHAEEITASEIQLVPGNIYEMRFEPGSFEFIYCMGVFGYGTALTDDLARNLHAWLAPAGRLYLDAIEVPSERPKDRVKKAVKSTLLPLLPASLRQRIAARQTGVPVIRHTRRDVERVMEAGGFHDFALSSNPCHSPLWSGVHLECMARKDAVTDPPTPRPALQFATAAEGGRESTVSRA